MTMARKTIDREFRDLARATNYPFTDLADLGFLGMDVLLDALVHVVGNYQLPFHVSKMRNSNGALELTLEDANSVEACSGVLETDSDAAFLNDVNGVHAGVVTHDPDKSAAAARLFGESGREFAVDELVLLTSTCFVHKTRSGARVKTDYASFGGEVDIVAADGVQIDLDEGSYRINLYGEYPDLSVPLKKINGVSTSHLWLCSHPNSAIRVVTEDGVLKLVLENEANDV